MSPSKPICWSALRLADHHSRDRHAQGKRAADRGHHLEPHARDPRRGEAALLLSLVDYRTRGASSRSCIARPQGAAALSKESWPSCSACARWSSTSCRASPRRSTGELPGGARPRGARPETVNNTLGVLLKYRDDLERVAARKPSAWSPRPERPRRPEPAMGAASFLRKLIGGGARAGVDRRTDALVSLCNALLAESGEYASTALARDALAAYQKLDERCREEFFGLLGRDYDRGRSRQRAAAAYQVEPTPETSCGCSRRSTRRGRSSFAASTWRPAARRRSWRCAASC